MIGQEKLFERLVTSRLPKSNLFIGEEGCGKHSFVKEICDRHKLDYVDITDDISKELVDELYISSKICAYVIDIVALSKKSRYINKENAILKLVEDPPQSSVIFILAEYESQVIDTIKNRCVIWKFESYTHDYLKEIKYYSDDRIYTLLNTPGKVIQGNDESYYQKLFGVCESIISNIHKANISNTLSLEKYMDFSDDTGYDLDLFFRCMKFMLYQKFLEDITHIDAFDLTTQFIEKLHTLNVNEKSLFDNYILELKGIYDKS